MIINSGSEICVMSKDITRELNIGWKRANWKIITADGNHLNLTKVSEAITIDIHRIVIPIPLFLDASGSEQVILGFPWETYTCKYERN